MRVNLKKLEHSSCLNIAFEKAITAGLRGLRGVMLSLCLMPGLFAFEMKLDIDSFLDLASIITFWVEGSEELDGIPVSRVVLPLDFKNEVGLNFLFDEQHLLKVSWELAFLNQGYLQFTSPNSWEKTWTARHLGERELENKVILDYLFQPLRVLWVTPYLEYHSKGGTHGANFNLRDSIFKYNGYRLGIEVGYHETGKYFTSLRQDTLEGWAVSTSLSYGGKIFDSDKFSLTNLNISRNSSPSSADVTLSLAGTNVLETLNYNEFVLDFKTIFKRNNMLFRLGYEYEINFIPNQLLLTDSPDSLSLIQDSVTASFQRVSLEYQVSFFERKAGKKGNSGDYGFDLNMGYFFETDSYDDRALKLDYSNPASLIESVHLLGEFDTIDSPAIRVADDNLFEATKLHEVGLYLQNDDEKFLHHIVLEPRFNYLPNRSLSIYSGTTIIDYKNFMLPHDRVDPGSLEFFLSIDDGIPTDALYSLRVTFSFFDFIGLRVSEFYLGWSALATFDRGLDAYAQTATMGFNLTYTF